MKYWESAQNFRILENFRFYVFRLGMPCNYLKIQQVPKSNKEYSTALLSLTGQWFVGTTTYHNSQHLHHMVLYTYNFDSLQYLGKMVKNLRLIWLI